MISMQRRGASGAVSAQQIIKNQNTTNLLNLVRKLAPISRAELARCSGLSPATVTALVEELLQDQWLEELEPLVQVARRGRRPAQLAVNAARGYVATVEILRRGYICGLYDIGLRKVHAARSREAGAGAKHVFRTLLEMLDANRIDRDRLLGVHVLFPGLFDEEHELLGESSVIPETDMPRRELVPELRALLPGARVLLSNNATAMAYAVFAAHRAELPLLAMTIQEGIDAGIVTGDHACRPLEAGHIILQRDGPRCQCGNRGCLEAFCSTQALFRMLRQETSLWLEVQNQYGEDANLAAMRLTAEAFHAGDAAVAAVLRRYALNLCGGIVSLVNVLAIRSVRIGGAVRLLGEPFAALLRQTLEEHFHITTSSRSLTLELFDDDYESTRKGAVMLLLEQLFRRG